MSASAHSALPDPRSALTFFALIGAAVADVVAAFVELGLGQSSPALMATRLVWGAIIVAVALATRGRRSKRRSILLAVCAGASALLFAVVLVLLGDVSGISFALYMTSPILIAALLQEEIAAVTVSSITTLAVGIAMFELLPGSSGTRVEWGIASLTVGVLAVHSSVLRRRAWTNAVALSNERLRHVATRANAERAALMGEVASGLAHEINNPLEVMAANLRFLQSATREAEPVEGEIADVLAESSSCAERIAAVVRRMKSLSVTDSGEGGRCEACAVAREEIKRIALPSSIELIDNIPAQMPPVAFSRVEVLRMVGQLLAGTLEALCSGTGSDAPRIVVSGCMVDGRVQLTLDDNGPTVRARSTDEGTFGSRGSDSGLGLVLLRELLQRRGGDVSVTSPAGGGEHVTVHLPLAATTPACNPARWR